MEHALETPPQAPTCPKSIDFDSKTPTQIHQTDQMLQKSGHDSPIITGPAPDRLKNFDFDSKTPTQIHQTDQKLQKTGHDSPIITGPAPDRLNVPKPFKYPERYTSPTDKMMSPISKGLLARSRKKPGMLLPPSVNQTKIQDLIVQEVALSLT